MAGEVIIFSGSFDVTATLSKEVQFLDGHDIPVQLFTESKYLVDVI